MIKFEGPVYYNCKNKSKKQEQKKTATQRETVLNFKQYQDYLPFDSIFFLRSARPEISPRVVFSADSDFFCAAFIFFSS